MLQIRHDTEDRFSASLNGVEKEAFIVKNVAFNISFLSFHDSQFLQIFQKNYFSPFLLMSAHFNLRNVYCIVYVTAYLVCKRE